MGKTLGDMTPPERAAAISNAAKAFQAELDATAPAIGKILEAGIDTPTAPMSRYRVIYSTAPTGSHTDFSAASDSEAWEHAEQQAYGARIVYLAEVHMRAGGDQTRELRR